MRITDLSNSVNEWFSGIGPMADIVISSRIRLARNIAGFNFLGKCSNEDKQHLLDKLKNALMSLDLGDRVFYISVDQANDLDRNFLIERHLISRNHAFGKGPRGAVIAEKESFTAMINEEDHLRLQVIKSGSQLQGCWQQINRIDDLLEQKVTYTFSPKLGYLTACPTNVGTGIRVSAMLHLPALKMVGHIEKFLTATKAMNLAVRGLFGEGTEATGDFYQLSNQVTLGISEPQIVSKFEETIIPEIVAYETAARIELAEKHLDLLDDKISRAMALLKNAHLISSNEALLLLSHLRLGINMHLHQGVTTPAIKKLFEQGSADSLPSLTIETINRLFMLTLPAHLQINYGKSLDSTHRDALRASIIRSALNQPHQ